MSIEELGIEGEQEEQERRAICDKFFCTGDRAWPVPPKHENCKHRFVYFDTHRKDEWLECDVWFWPGINVVFQGNN